MQLKKRTNWMRDICLLAVICAGTAFASDLEFTKNGDGTVTQVETNLTWQSADNDGNVDWLSAKNFCSSLRLADHENWRLPTVSELESLYAPGSRESYKIEGEIALTTGYLWSDRKDGSGTALLYDYRRGHSSSFVRGSSNGMRALCVRDNVSAPLVSKSGFIDSGDGAVTQVATSLSFQKEDNDDNIDWQHGVEFCNSLKLGGHENWRLPSISELESLYDPGSKEKYRIKGEIVLTTGFLWSDRKDGAGTALLYDYRYGRRSSFVRGSSNGVRVLCVRETNSGNR